MHAAIARALTRIAAREGRDVTDLPPLYDTVDPEAVGSVLESPAAVTVEFEYEGYRVAVGPELEAVEVIDEER